MSLDPLQIHLAGTYPAGFRHSSLGMTLEPRYKDILDEYPYLLESYHYIGGTEKFTDEIRSDGAKIFLDSGAFSMFTQGIEVDMGAYVDFIKRNKDIINVASVLDGIGDPVLTKENQKKLEDMGAEVLPCFHYGEPLEFLYHYMDNYEYITIGGMVPISTVNLFKWLNEIWTIMSDKDGVPRLKVHGFGLTVTDLMFRYPWYSVDSTSWVLTGRFGSIYWPLPGGRETKIVISDRSPRVKDFDRHFDSMSRREQDTVRTYIEYRGFTVEELKSEYWKRDLWNIQYFRDLCRRPREPFKRVHEGLFA